MWMTSKQHKETAVVQADGLLDVRYRFDALCHIWKLLAFVSQFHYVQKQHIWGKKEKIHLPDRRYFLDCQGAISGLQVSEKIHVALNHVHSNHIFTFTLFNLHRE